MASSKITAKKAASKAAGSKGAAIQPVQPQQAAAVAPGATSDPPKVDSSGIIDEVTLNWTDLTGAKTGATSALCSSK